MTKRTTTKRAAKAGKPGVIAAIVSQISKPAGATRAELVAALTKLFPDRRPEAMAITVGIQANKHATRKTKDKDGVVRYFGKATR
jgi:hypothetical protein